MAGRNAGFSAITHECNGLGAPSLFVSTSACIQKEVWIGSNSVGHFVWATPVFWSFLPMDALQFETASFIAIPHEQDGLGGNISFARIKDFAILVL
jgi:hypothetical protein